MQLEILWPAPSRSSTSPTTLSNNICERKDLSIRNQWTKLTNQLLPIN